MWEMTSGVPAFNKRSHDFNLALEVCQGLRPDIVEETMPEYVELMKRCCDFDPNKRPTAEELAKYFREWQVKYEYSYSDRVPVPGK